MIKVAGIVVTYNRKKMLEKNLQCLLKQDYPLEKIYLIDNCSTDGTCEYMENLIKNNPQIEYIRLEENLGGSKGFEVGVKKAYEDEADCVWGMDDDAFPERDALQKLVDVYSKMPEDTCLWSNSLNHTDFESEYKEIKDWWLFVGFFVPRTVIKKIGFPRGDLFIYGDDDEYFHRIVKNGFKIYEVRDSIIKHKANLAKEKYEKKIFGRKITFRKVSDWRLYYVVRNRILKYKYNEIEKYKAIFVDTFKDFIKLLLLNPKQIPIFVKAWWHGIIGKAGKTVLP